LEQSQQSALYRYLSEVGIEAKTPGRIEFSTVDMDKVLEALVADGDNFLLEGLYSYAKPGWNVTLCVELSNPNQVPDMSGWSEKRRQDYLTHSDIAYIEGECPSHAYNVDTDQIEEFDPISFQPRPRRYVVIDHVEDYRRLYNQVRKAKGLGYRMDSICLDESGDLSIDLSFDKIGNFNHFKYTNLQIARHNLGHLIPGLE